LRPWRKKRFLPWKRRIRRELRRAWQAAAVERDEEMVV